MQIVLQARNTKCEAAERELQGCHERIARAVETLATVNEPTQEPPSPAPGWHDPKLFPEFDQETIVEMRRSLDVFIDDVVWNESSDYRELLLADYLYLNAKLADFIGEGTFKGSDFRKVHFDPKARAGVLTHPYLLARFAYHRTTSPIHRGVFVTRNVLGRSLKPPPEAVKFEESRFDPHLTMREKVTELTKSKACMNCHSMINPLGFSLERFDAVGRFRFEEKNRPIEIEASYEAPDGKRIVINGARDVAEHAATNREAQRGFIQHLFEHLSYFVVFHSSCFYFPITDTPWHCYEFH